MNKHQFRAIRHSFERDKIYLKGGEYHNDLLDHPLMRTKVEDIVLNGKKVNKKDIRVQYELTKGKNVYKTYSFDYKHTSQYLYIITLNDRIIYWTTSSIFRPASDSFHILTEVYHYYFVPWQGSWQWASKDDFDCIEHYWDNYDWKNDKIYLRSHLSSYRLEMLEKTGKVYIDKCICPIFDGHLELPKMTHWL
jgi:hypothetical protein